MFGILYFGIAIIFFIEYVWAIVDVIQAKNSEFTAIEGDNAKIAWLIIVILVPFGALLIYPIVEKRLYMREGFSISSEKSRIFGEST